MSSGKKWGMVIDVRKCIGCHACSAACRIEHSVSKEGNRSWVTQEEVGAYPEVHTLKLPQLCNHCNVTPCVEVCPVEATGKSEEGIVLVDREKCIGCYVCVDACPYEARLKDTENKKVDKCDYCIHRLAHGMIPACVSTCTTQARYFGDLNDENSQVSKLLKENAYDVLLSEKGLEPNVYYIGIKHYRGL